MKLLTTWIFFSLHNTTFQEAILRDLIRKVIIQTLNDSFCINLISELTFISDYVVNSLLDASIPTILTPPSDLLHCNKTLLCNGYIILTNNHTFLESVFTNDHKTGKFCFRVHKKIMIFYDGYGTFNTRTFLTAARFEGYHLIVVEGLQEVVSNFQDTNIKWMNKGVAIGRKNNNTTNESRIVVKISYIQLNKTITISRYTQDISELSLKKHTWIPDFHYTGKGYTYNISFFHWSPYTIVNGTNLVDGIEYLMVKEIGKGWPIKYNYQVNTTGFWEANIMDTINFNSEIAICGQWQLGRAIDYIETTYPYSDCCATFLVPKPYLVSKMSYVFQPIHPLFCFLFALMVLGIGCVWYETSVTYYKISKRTLPWLNRNFANGILNSIKIFTLHPLHPYPNAPQTIFHCIVISWFFVSFVISSSCSSVFISTNTYSHHTTPINTISDMVKQNIFWGSMETLTYDVYSNSTNINLLTLVKRFKKERSVQEKLHRIRSRNYAITVNTLQSKYVTDIEMLDENAKETMKILPVCAGIYQVIWGVRKNSPFLEIINRYMFKFVEGGHIERWMSQLRKRQNLDFVNKFFNSYSDPILNKNVPLNLSNFTSVFIFFLVGNLVAFFVFLIESKIGNSR